MIDTSATPSPAEVACFMRQHGGNFVRAIAAAYMAGDETNRETLVRAFETYWREYATLLLIKRAHLERTCNDMRNVYADGMR